MNIRTLDFIAFSAFAIGLVAHELVAGEVEREQRQVKGFNQVVLRGVGDLIITQADEESLVVEAEQALLPKISTEVKNGVLYFDFKARTISTQYPIRFFLTVKTLSSIRSEGSGDISAAQLNLGSLALDMKGSGSANLEALSAKQFTLKISGSGGVKVGGGALATQSITLNGSGDYAAELLASDKTRVRIGGSGSAIVAAKTTLTVQISGSGKVSYYGDPQVEQSITGAGSVEKL